MLPDRPIAALAAFLALAAPAAASGGVYCQGDGASVDIALGHLVVVQVLGAAIEVDNVAYSTGPERGPGIPIVTGQAFGDDDHLLFDFTDPNIETILASVRLNFVKGNEDYPLAGTVTIAGKPPKLIICSGE